MLHPIETSRQKSIYQNKKVNLKEKRKKKQTKKTKI